MPPDPDAELFLAFKRGDASAFRRLYERHARAMIAFCHHFVRNAARAEELAQDVFVKVYRSADRYQPSARFKTFLYRIASNHCLNELRRGEYGARPSTGPEDEPTDPDSLAGTDAGPDKTVEARKLEAAVQVLLDRLPDNQRTAFVLARFEGLPYDDIALVLDTSVSAVKSLVHRATVTAAQALSPFTGDKSEEVLS